MAGSRSTVDTTSPQDDETVDLSARVEAARARGYSRRWLTERAGLVGTTALWRTHRLTADEGAKLGAVLDQVEAGTETPPRRGRPPAAHPSS